MWGGRSAADPAPEYQWALAEAIHAAGRTDEARALDAAIEKTDPAIDPRTLALYFATRRALITWRSAISSRTAARVS